MMICGSQKGIVNMQNITKQEYLNSTSAKYVTP